MMRLVQTPALGIGDPEFVAPELRRGNPKQLPKALCRVHKALEPRLPGNIGNSVIRSPDQLQTATELGNTKKLPRRFACQNPNPPIEIPSAEPGG